MCSTSLINKSDSTALETGYFLNNELEKIWKEAGVASFKVLSQYLPGETEENHEILSQ
jgi:hypothetical protein